MSMEEEPFDGDYFEESPHFEETEPHAQALLELSSQSAVKQRATQQAMWVSFRGTL